MYDPLKEYEITKTIFLDNSERIIHDIDNSKYKNSNKALFYLNKKIDDLLTAIEPLQKHNYYSSQVILRVIFEHYLLGHYIWTKTRIEKNDDCGKEYYVDYFVSEYLKRLSYDLKIDSIVDKTISTDLLNQFQSKFPQHKDATQEDIDRIHKTANQFDIRHILDYTLNKTPKNDFFEHVHKTFHHFLRDYNKLSSFIHGGPSAENETYHELPKVDKDIQIIQNIGWAKTGSRLVKFYVLSSLLEQEDLKPFYKTIMEPLLSYLNQSEG